MKIVNSKFRISSGFSLIEMVVGAAVFAVVVVSVMQTYSSFLSLVALGKAKIAAADVVNADFELIRNMPYENVGLISGLPPGVLSETDTAVRDGFTFEITRTIRNIDDPFDGIQGGSPNDLSPADYKMVEIYVECPACKNFTPAYIVGYVAPKNLETASGNGSLFVRVFDANGNPVPQANVHIEKNTAPFVLLNDVTDNQGLLAVVDAWPGQNIYEITATKSGFTTDRTYATSTGNPNPTKPHATVLVGQVTQVSFIIDKVSAISVRTIDSHCQSISDIPFSVQGSKLIGTSPDVIKFDNNYTTDSAGQKTLSNVEWDTFSVTAGNSTFKLAGVNPAMLLSILPDSSQNIDFILTDAGPAHFLAIVKDLSTQLPVSGAVVSLTSSSTGFSKDVITGRGYMEQTDWSGGAGQTNFTDSTRYFNDDGNVETANPAGEVKLRESLGQFVPSGELTSSIFDTGTSSNWSNIVWDPTAQPPETGAGSVRFQIATASANTATTTWTFLGPDGTAGTFYDISDANINPVHNGDRYFRYKLYLNTLDQNHTPNVAGVAVTFSSECIPPGQAVFNNVVNGNYDISVSKSGYQTWVSPFNINLEWQPLNVNLVPE